MNWFLRDFCTMKILGSERTHLHCSYLTTRTHTVLDRGSCIQAIFAELRARICVGWGATSILGLAMATWKMGPGSKEEMGFCALVLTGSASARQLSDHQHRLEKHKTQVGFFFHFKFNSVFGKIIFEQKNCKSVLL